MWKNWFPHFFCERDTWCCWQSCGFQSHQLEVKGSILELRELSLVERRAYLQQFLSFVSVQLVVSKFLSAANTKLQKSLGDCSPWFYTYFNSSPTLTINLTLTLNGCVLLLSCDLDFAWRQQWCIPMFVGCGLWRLQSELKLYLAANSIYAHMQIVWLSGPQHQ